MTSLPPPTATPPTHLPPLPGVTRYRPLPWRRRILIVLLAVATAVAVVLTLLNPPGGVQRKRPPRAEPARCSGAQAQDCVGGATAVMVPPAAPSAAR